MAQTRHRGLDRVHLDVYLQSGCLQFDQATKAAAYRMSSRISPRPAKQPWEHSKSQEIDQQTMTSQAGPTKYWPNRIFSAAC
jgi:hypothetical protein